MIGESILQLHEINTMNISWLLAGAGHITINIENQDQFLHLHNAYLLIESDVSKADNASYAESDLVGITYNGLLYLFSSVKLELAGHTMEHV